MNVSLPPAMEQFVRAQVESGRYRSASEVVRDGLRMLEQQEHRRLVEKWVYQDLDEAEAGQLPLYLRTRVQEYLAKLIDEARADINAGRMADELGAMARIESKLRARFESERRRLP